MNKKLNYEVNDKDSNEEDESQLKHHDNRPLMRLFKRLIYGQDSKQSTVLTNSQLIDILQKEFNINITDLPVLEVDIYMNIMKKFLKDWPQWDEFDRIMSDMKDVDDQKVSKNVLEEKYNNLKIYLSDVLKVCQPLAKEAVEKVIPVTTVDAASTSSNKKTEDSTDVIMEVICTRSQLNQLFFRTPNMNLNNTIFNVTENVPSKISLHNFFLRSIINWPSVVINIKLDTFVYKRETTHKLQHKLVNKKLKNSVKPAPVDESLLEKPGKAAFSQEYDKSMITKVIDKLVHSLTREDNNNAHNNLVRAIFDLVKEDLDYLPKHVKMKKLYKKPANMYPYVRYLYKDIDQVAKSDKYNLQLEETIIPSYVFYIGQVLATPSQTTIGSPPKGWLQLECVSCQKKFFGSSLKSWMDNAIQHFNEAHQHEPDWQCSNCLRVFTMMSLADNRWYHKC